MNRYGTCLLCLLLAVGCAAAPQGPQIDLEAERGALMDADRAWFESHPDVEAFAGFLSDEARFMAMGAPLAQGRDDIVSAWEQMLATPGFELTWQATGADVAEAGDLGYTVGTFRLSVAPEGDPVVTVGKYVTVWKKQADGSWKVAVDCFNSDGPAAGA